MDDGANTHQEKNQGEDYWYLFIHLCTRKYYFIINWYKLGSDLSTFYNLTIFFVFAIILGLKRHIIRTMVEKLELNFLGFFIISLQEEIINK